MKDIFGAFNNEVFKPLVTRCIPGLVALSTWLVLLDSKSSAVHRLLQGGGWDVILLLAITAITAGMILEDVGTLVETKILDKRLKKRTKGYDPDAEWDEYMRVAYEIEPVGERCLRAMVLRMKFELGMAFALVSACVGLLYTGVGSHMALRLAGGLVALMLYMLWEARSSHQALAEIRHELLKGIRLIGHETPPQAGAAAAGKQ